MRSQSGRGVPGTGAGRSGKFESMLKGAAIRGLAPILRIRMARDKPCDMRVVSQFEVECGKEPIGRMMFGMAWKADRTTIYAALALMGGGCSRMWFAHDFVLGGACFGVGVILAIRTTLYFRRPDA